MKTKLQSVLIIISLVISLNATAEETQKKFTIGLGTYALNISYDNALVGTDDELSGLGLSASYAFSNQFAVRGEYYSLEHNDFSIIDVTGIDLVAYIGTRLATQGFKAYIGGGIYSETWEVGPIEEDFSGVQLNGGIGYNWDVVALDLALGIRDTNDYTDFIIKNRGINTDATAISGSLILSARF